jgi:uncharacterized protein (TIGR03067 family)
MKRTLLLAVVAGLLIAADAKDDAKEDLKKFQGTWSTSAEQNGEKAPQNATVVIKDNTYTVKVGDKTVDSGTFKLGAEKKVKTIDSTADIGPGKGKTMLGIYEIDGETIKICFAMPEKERPKEFEAKKGSDHVLYVMKKEKK